MIVCCGEAVMDLLPEADGRFVPVPGGSPVNVAIGLARLGVPSGYLWEISHDPFGRTFERLLRAEGVDISAITRAPRPTPAAVIDLSGGEASFNIADAGRVMVDTALAPLPAGTRCLAMGSAVLAAEPVAGAIEALAATASATTIDYNVRPFAIRDLDRYRARLARLSRTALVVKASVADLAHLGLAHDLAAATDFMAGLVAAGTPLAVVTAAHEGAVAAARCGRVHVPSRANALADTVGAGDAFMAGLLAHLSAANRLSRAALATLDTDALHAMLADAQRVAAFTCTKVGAQMPFPADLSHVDEAGVGLLTGRRGGMRATAGGHQL